MSFYTAKQAAEILGISVYRLRVWEQRYQTSQPKRSESGHRLYTRQEIDHLRRLVELVKRGHRISNLIALTDDKLDALLKETPVPAKPLTPVVVILTARTTAREIERTLRKMAENLPSETPLWVLLPKAPPKHLELANPVRWFRKLDELADALHKS